MKNGQGKHFNVGTPRSERALGAADNSSPHISSSLLSSALISEPMFHRKPEYFNTYATQYLVWLAIFRSPHKVTSLPLPLFVLQTTGKTAKGLGRI